MSDSNRGKRSEAVGSAFTILVAIALVAVIVGVLAFSQGRETEKRQQARAAYAKSSKQAAQRACIGSDPAVVFECVHEIVEASQQQAQAEQDLDAQQGMKFWAAVMAILTGLTVAITAIGVWFVKRTLDATLQAVKDTGEATKAMVRQNELTEIAQRPWLKIEAVASVV